ncbi:MAG: hypothetical protein ACREBW_01500 [Candidatus Micrarchaeaceae archaeon]
MSVNSTDLVAFLNNELYENILIKLLAAGVSVSTISNALDLDSDYIQSLSPRRSLYMAESEELAEAMHKLAWRAYEEGMRILDEGTPAMRLRMVTSIQSASLRLLGSQDPHQFEELRSELRGLIAGIGGDNATILSEPASLGGETDDSEEGPNG